jgi:hypothetical protein
MWPAFALNALRKTAREQCVRPPIVTKLGRHATVPDAGEFFNAIRLKTAGFAPKEIPSPEADKANILIFLSSLEGKAAG